ncbi:MAG: zinc ribbon domain-containing protein [Candidatus Hodarchaeales archaeon]|jgi:hypothetical protein
MKNCESCGVENSDNVAYCISCGKKFSSAGFPVVRQANYPYTGFSLNSESVRILWVIAIMVGVVEVVIAYILTSGMSASSTSDFIPLGLVVGFILCIVYGYLVLINAEPSGESPWSASKKVAKILIVVGLITLSAATFLSVSEVDNEAMNQAMLAGESYDFPPLADMGGALGLIPIFSWLLGGFLFIYGITKFQLNQLIKK